MNDPYAKKSSSDQVIQTLTWARKQGFRPVALRKQSKAAIGQSYVEVNYTAPGDDYWRSNDIGIGVVTGPKFSGPIDIDLDCMEAIFFAQRFLPQTPAVFGRKSKPKSHYIYLINEEDCAKKAFNDPLLKSGTTIIEIRGDGGHQTVFPGSLHETTGEQIEWAGAPFPEVPRVNKDDLEAAVKKVAIATLVARHMWADGQRNEICKHLTGMLYYLDWSLEEVRDLIQAVMDFTGDDDKTRMKTVDQTFAKGEKGGKITGSKTLMDFLGETKVVERILEWAGNEVAVLIQQYNERYAVVTLEGKFRIADTVPYKRGAAPMFYAKEDFLNVTAPDTIVSAEGKPVQKASIWLKSTRRRTYVTADFLPGTEDSSPILNLWTGWGVDPSPKGSCAAWLDLIYYTICGSDDDLNKWLLNWFANIVREPQNKTKTAPVIIGRQGAGKSLAVRYFGRILGDAYNMVTNSEHVHGRFNKHLSNTLLLHSEEALFAGDRRQSQIMKSLISDETKTHEQKGVDAKQINNFMRIVFSSNETWAAPVEDGDRRYTIFDLGKRKATAATIKGVLEELKDDNGPSALMHYLLNEIKYEPELARENVKNEALMMLKEINFDPVAQWWYDVLKSGQLLPDYMMWCGKPEREEWPKVVSSAALYVACLAHMRTSSQRYMPDSTTFAVRLNVMLGERLHRSQRYFTNPMSDAAPPEVRRMQSKQYAIDNMPNLEVCRRAFADFAGQPVEWPADVPEEDKPAHLKY